MATEQRGPFDRILKTRDGGEPAGPDRAAIYVLGTIAGLALLLLVLVLPPISILSRGDGDGGIPSEPGIADTYTSTVRSGMPKLPAGLVAASPMFDLAAPEDQRGASGVTVPLKEQATDARNLGLYSYIDQQWERLSDVTLVAGGEAVRGEVSQLPGNVAVLRRSRATLQVAGLLPAGTTLDARADSVLTTLHPIAFIPIDTGEILGQRPAVPPAGYEVAPVVVAPNPLVVDDILRSAELRDRHAAAIAAAVTQGNFAGISIDYRNVNVTLREQFTQFVDQLAQLLDQDNRTLSLTLPMPASDSGELDTGAYDWEALGVSADTIEITGELDQELYFQNTEAALEYIVERVDRSKLLLTISSQSVERGSDGLRVLTLPEAMAIASTVAVRTEGAIVPGQQVTLAGQNIATSEGASGITWDDAARAVTFKYPGRGGQRTVWIANRFSAAFRLELAQRFELAGVTITDATDVTGSDVWEPIRDLADTGNLSLSRPNGDLFAPTWSASAGAITPTSGDTTTWTAPAGTGTYEITLIVSDGVVRLGQRVPIEVVGAE